MRAGRVVAPPEKPLLIFDGECGFCRWWIERWKSITGDRLDYAPSQEVAERFPEIPKETFARSVQLVAPNGEVYEGAHAVFRSLALVPGRRGLLWSYENLPGFAAVTEAAYRFIARHRTAGLAVTRALWGRRQERPTYAIAASLLPRLLGLCYLAAFVSLWVQIDGLIGSRGILSVSRFLDWAGAQVPGPARFHLLPTLCWLNASDGFLHVLCGAGVLLSL